MKKILTLALASTGLIVAVASPASAAPEREVFKANYGQCVKIGLVTPSDGVEGPTTPTAAIRSAKGDDFAGPGGDFRTPSLNSNGNARFELSEASCWPAP